ncbi:MAG: NAD(P)-binding domain-containing protein [Ruminococcus sp.]|nr:NAD(P)-binding domain-containing protein [Ruminococcus sp.]
MNGINILVLGGDARAIYMCEQLAESFNVTACKLPARPEGAAVISRLEDMPSKADALILPMLTGVRHTADGSFLPCGLEVICLERLLPLLCEGAPVLGGLADSGTVSLFESAGHPFADYFKRRELTVRNCIPTAEGALMIAMQEQAQTVFGSSVLAIGFGNVGRAVARLFSAVGAKVSCAVRRPDAAAEAESEGFAPVVMSQLAESISRFDTVINTAPALVIDEPLLKNMKPKALIIDLASRPGGVDKAAAEALGVRLVHALALPGRVAPVTAGRYIAETVTDILTERGVGNVT